MCSDVGIISINSSKASREAIGVFAFFVIVFGVSSQDMQPTIVALQRDSVVASNVHKEVLAGVHSTCWE